MSIDFNDEILQDFLIEAGEIMELLDEQLVELESNPNDSELLNAIFRGFHTIKGGAGFLAIDALVILCHRAEDVFNLLRQGDLRIERNLMDVILEVHDNLRGMFNAINNTEDPDYASQALIESLESFLNGNIGEVQGKGSESLDNNLVEEIEITELPNDDDTNIAENSADGTPSSGEDITDDEFEELLDTLHGSSIPNATNIELTADAANQKECLNKESDDITEDEFESLLDNIHGGAVPGEVKKHGDYSTQIEGKGEGLSVPFYESHPGNSVNDDHVSDQSFEKVNIDITTTINPPVNNADVISSGKEEPSDLVGRIPNNVTKKPIKSIKKDDKQGRQQESTVRVDTGRLDDIMNLVGELVLVRNRLSTLESTFVNEEMSIAVSNLDLVTSDLQTAVMKTRMQPIKKVFGRFPRVVRDLSRSLNKDVDLIMIGEETDLDKNLVEALADPLIHLVRNSVDHGVESPEVREKAGKPTKGIITLSAEQKGEYILLSIEDDGAGIDPDIIRSKAVEKGLIDFDTASRMADDECYNLILMPGFSTKDNISDISGRGVGMDVVKTKISQLNGSINIKSVKGNGSRIEIKVPLTLAIMPTLMVIISGQVYALPLASVVEIFNYDEGSAKTVDGQDVLIIRNKALPIFHLNTWLSSKQMSDKIDKRIVVVNSAGKDYGLIVDALLGQEEVVIKPLGALLQGTQGISGATITGDGKISLILDVPGLMKNHANGL